MAKPAPLCVRAYLTGDEARFAMRADFAREAAADLWDWSTGPPGPTWTLCKAPGDRVAAVLGVAGLTAYAPELWHLWARLGPLGRRQWGEALCLTGIILDRFHAAHPAARVTAQAATGAAERCLRRLGFVVDGEAQAGYLLLTKEGG